MKIKVTFIIALVFFTFLLFIIPSRFINSEYGSTVLTVSTFLFGIFGGFCVAVTTTDYNNVRALAARETSAWISLYQIMRIYGKKYADGIRPYISRYIIRSFDYDFINYARETRNDFKPVMEYIKKVPIILSKSSIHQNMIDQMVELVAVRQELTALGKRSLSSLEWIVLCILSCIVIITLFGLRGGNIFFDFVTVAISSATVLVLLLIRDIDRYIWNEASFSFDVFNNVLLNLAELPYYPAEFIASGVVRPKEQKYRVGILKKPGQSWERKFKIVTN